MDKLTKIGIGIVVLGSLLVVTACGGDDDAKPAPTTKVTIPESVVETTTP